MVPEPRPRRMVPSCRRRRNVGQVCANGARRGEVLAARWCDIKGSAFHLTRSLSQTREGLEFKNTKTEKPRVIELPPSMVARLEAHRIRQNEFRRQYGPDYRRYTADIVNRCKLRWKSRRERLNDH